tara:strand:- start:1218 stop:2105 length:888 start_codon:yes stop_codon:yes gene_type:complete
MSTIKVNELENSSSNLKLASKGTGLVKVKGANTDGTLKLSSGTHGVKIKSPNHSSGQSYTMILPDNNIEANKFLKVKSITGSGATAVGQLEYVTINTQLSNLNADIIDAGTLNSARIPSLTATKGTALELVSKQTVTSSVSSITFTGLEDDTMYKMVGKYLIFSNTTTIQMEWLDSSGNAQSNITYENITYASSSNPDSFTSVSTSNNIKFSFVNQHEFAFVADISNVAANNWMTVWGFQPGYNTGSKSEVYATFNTSGSTQRIHGIRLSPVGSIRYFISPTEVLLYKYKEDGLP